MVGLGIFFHQQYMDKCIYLEIPNKGCQMVPSQGGKRSPSLTVFADGRYIYIYIFIYICIYIYYKRLWLQIPIPASSKWPGLIPQMEVTNKPWKGHLLWVQTRSRLEEPGRNIAFTIIYQSQGSPLKKNGWSYKPYVFWKKTKHLKNSWAKSLIGF